MCSNARRNLSDAIGRLREKAEQAETNTKRLVNELIDQDTKGWSLPAAEAAEAKALSLAESGTSLAEEAELAAAALDELIGEMKEENKREEA